MVQVGEVENLCKTKKSCHLHHSADVTTIDLHGYTEIKALENLNKRLPEWVDIAMKREYPFVVTVKIVCGCGSQILSETVHEWIKSTGNIRNAPKNYLQ